MWALLTQAPATTQCVFLKKKEWIDHSAFHEAPLRNAIVRFEPHVAVISLFFALSTSSYLLIDSHDVETAFQGILEFHSFTRPSRSAVSVGTSLFTLSQISRGGVDWRESLGTGRLPSNREIFSQKRDLPSPIARSFTFLCVCRK